MPVVTTREPADRECSRYIPACCFAHVNHLAACSRRTATLGVGRDAFLHVFVLPPGRSSFSHVLVDKEMAGDAGRIRKELAECARDTDSGVTAVPKGDSLARLEGTILGPVVRRRGVVCCCCC